jgi:microcystin-dependent protein
MTSPSTVARRHFLARLLGALAGGAWVGSQGLASGSEAGQSDLPYFGEIRMFAADWAPVGWLICDGSMLMIANYETLWQLIGTTYGGDGQTTFALPDLRGRLPFHPGTMLLAQTAGEEAVTLGPFQAPLHAHNLQGNSGLGSSDSPAGGVPARNGLGSPHYGSVVNAWFATDALMPAGQSQAHNNLMPSLCINFIICVEGGVWPPPS